VAGRTVEQRDAQLPLQPADLLAHRRLSDVQALGGPAEMPLLGDGDHVAELAQFHPCSVPGPPGRSATVIPVQRQYWFMPPARDGSAGDPLR
jgi:hypothetical protein